jgi:hypothetical protein
MNNNTVLPLKTLISLASDIEEALSIASFHLEHQIKTVKGVWDDTAIPELCNYYSCLFTLRKLLLAELTAITPDQAVQGQVEVPVQEVQIMSALLQESEIMKDGLKKHGISMVVH